MNKTQAPASQAAQLSGSTSDSVKFGSFGGALSGSNFYAASGSRSSSSRRSPSPPTEAELQAAQEARAKSEAEFQARIAALLNEKMNSLLEGPLKHAELPIDVDQALNRISQANPGKNVLEILGKALELGQFGAPRREARFFRTQPSPVDELPAATIPALRSRHLPSLAEWPLHLKFQLKQQTLGRFKNGQMEEKLINDPAYAQKHEREIAVILSQVLTTVINRLDPANA